jgi:hypothetical protein
LCQYERDQQIASDAIQTAYIHPIEYHLVINRIDKLIELDDRFYNKEQTDQHKETYISCNSNIFGFRPDQCLDM